MYICLYLVTNLSKLLQTHNSNATKVKITASSIPKNWREVFQSQIKLSNNVYFSTVKFRRKVRLRIPYADFNIALYKNKIWLNVKIMSSWKKGWLEVRYWKLPSSVSDHNLKAVEGLVKAVDGSWCSSRRYQECLN
jgi:hypothetical protein